MARTSFFYLFVSRPLKGLVLEDDLASEEPLSPFPFIAYSIYMKSKALLRCGFTRKHGGDVSSGVILLFVDPTLVRASWVGSPGNSPQFQDVLRDDSWSPGPT